MRKNILKLAGIATGVAALIYWLQRKYPIWELEAVRKSKQQLPTSSTPATSYAPKAEKAEADDLKQIKGIGQVIEGKLNELGIRTFRQIAHLTYEQKRAIEERLTFTGRIDRDRWVEQAQALISAPQP